MRVMRKSKKLPVNENSKVLEFPKGIDKDKYIELLQSNSLVIVDTYTTWCSPCKAMKPIFEELSEQYENKIKFISIDLDESNWIGSYEEYDIESIPTFLLIKESKLIKKQVGGLDKSDFIKIINKFFGKL